MGRKSKAEIVRNRGASARSNPGNKTFHPQAQLHERRLTFGVCLFLALVVWAVFGQTLHHDFVNYDDDTFVTHNPHVLGGLTWEGIKWAFRFDQGDYWHPLTWLSLMLDVSVFGRGAGGMHLTNVLLHTANSLLLFLLLRRWTGALWRSGLVAALFAIHPLRVESVAWVTERKDVLSTLFWMLTLWAYTSYAGGAKARIPRSKLFYGLALLLFVLGLMSKAMLITLPLVMLLLDYWPLERIRNSEFGIRNFKGLLLEKIPFFLFSGISVGLTYWGQHRKPTASTAADASILLRLENVFVAYARYLEKTFWPVNLEMPYPHPGHWNWLEVGWSVALVVGFCVVAWWLGRRKPYVLVGWFWFVITLIPVIGLTRGWQQFMADRFTYVPLTGIFLMAVWGTSDLCHAGRYRRFVLGSAAVAILAGLSAGAYVQTGYWKNSLTLWTHNLGCTPDDPKAECGLGLALIDAGKTNEAIHHFELALQINPDYVEAHNCLGRTLEDQGNLAGAIPHFERALQLNPADAGASYNWGNALVAQGKLPEAIQQFERALQFYPDDAGAHNSLGTALARQRRFPEAIPHFERALALNPDYAEAHNNLGNALASQQRLPEAIPHFERALALNPDYVGARYNLACSLAQAGKVNEAVEQFRQALSLATDRGDDALAENIRARLQSFQPASSQSQKP